MISVRASLSSAMIWAMFMTASAFAPTPRQSSIRIAYKLHAASTWNEEELMKRASDEGVALTLTTLGPGFRAVARNKNDESQILGYVEGFLRPSGEMIHLDKMEVFAKMVKAGRRENPEFRGGGTILGVGLLMGFLCLLHGKEKGYSQAEFLAIDDEDKQHRRLVRFYKVSGFKVIRYVGEGVQDIPDRLVWGGRGTLMRETVDGLLTKWASLLEGDRKR